MAKRPNPPKASGDKKKYTWTAISVIFILVGLVIVAMPTVILMFFGLLPTMAAFLTDKTKQKTTTFCVGAMNFAGLFPYLYDLWGGANSLGTAIEMLANVFSLFVIYGAAGFGLLIFNWIPPIIGSFLSTVNERRMKVLRKRQRQLVEEWGDDVGESEHAPSKSTPAAPTPTEGPSNPKTRATNA